jgi:hydrogenase maturation protease
MSASAEPRPLIIGIGNPLRNDDGLGWVAAERIAQAMGDMADVATVHQLTPELAEDIAVASLVIVIDASIVGRPGTMQVERILPDEAEATLATHHYGPESLVALTTAIHGACPPCYVISVTGENFDLGEQLSATVSHQLPAIVTTIWQLCANRIEKQQATSSRTANSPMGEGQ